MSEMKRWSDQDVVGHFTEIRVCHPDTDEPCLDNIGRAWVEDHYDHLCELLRDGLRQAARDAEIRKLVGASDRCVYRERPNSRLCDDIADSPWHKMGDRAMSISAHPFTPESTLDAVRRGLTVAHESSDAFLFWADELANRLGRDAHSPQVAELFIEAEVARLLTQRLTDSARDRAAERIVKGSWRIAAGWQEQAKEVAAIIDEERNASLRPSHSVPE